MAREDGSRDSLQQAVGALKLLPGGCNQLLSLAHRGRMGVLLSSLCKDVDVW